MAPSQPALTSSSSANSRYSSRLTSKVFPADTPHFSCISKRKHVHNAPFKTLSIACNHNILRASRLRRRSKRFLTTTTRSLLIKTCQRLRSLVSVILTDTMNATHTTYMRPHNASRTKMVFSYYVCVLTLLYMCPQLKLCAHTRATRVLRPSLRQDERVAPSYG